MKKLTSYLSLKIIAVAALILSVLVGTFCVTGIVELAEQGAYIDGGKAFRQNLVYSLMHEDVELLRTRCSLFNGTMELPPDKTQVQKQLVSLFDPDSSNFICSIYDENDELIAQNRPEPDSGVLQIVGCKAYDASDRRELVRSFDTQAQAERYVRTQLSDPLPEMELRETTITVAQDETAELTAVYLPYRSFSVHTAYDTSLQATDHYYYAERMLGSLLQFRGTLMWVSVACALIFFPLLCFLFSAAGHKRGVPGIRENWSDKIPFDLFFLLILLLRFLPSWLWNAEERLRQIPASNYLLRILLTSLLVALHIGLALWCVLSLTTRCKKGTLVTNTLLYRGIKGLRRGVQYLEWNSAMFWRILLAALVFAIIEATTILLLEQRTLLIVWLALKIVSFPFLAKLATNIYQLEQTEKALNRGELDTKINVDRMLPFFRRFARDINNVGDVMQNALDERMRSERMKAELITNVSHDIKTPLTSIVSYVDLLKTKGLDSENAPEYLDVLVRQSARMKKLISDLVDTAKASTGAITVEAEPTDVAVVLTQAAGEYAARMEEKDLRLVLDLQEDLPLILADPKLLWRIFDNLLNNALKYTQPGTRVYLSARREGDATAVVFRNVSGQPLNISPEELLERFVRGDSSRNTEGSGLGLSISRSLTELQDGSFELTIDGDLFKVILTFPISPDPPETEASET